MTVGALGILVRRDLRKRPGQVVAVFVLALLAGMLANTGLMLVGSYPANLGEKSAAWDSPDSVVLLGHTPGWERVVDDLRADPAVARVDTRDQLTGPVTLAYGANELTALASLYNVDAPVGMGRRTVTAIADHPVPDPVWAPAVLSASGHYALGDPVTLATTTGEVTFHIQAFVEDTYSGTPGFGRFAWGLPADDYAAFEASDFVPTTLVQVDAGDVSAATSAIGRATSQDIPIAILWDANLDLLTTGAGLSAGIFSTILIAFAAIIVTIAVVVLRFLLRNAITVDMASIGMLRAGGWTTGGVMAALVATFATVAVAASVAGIGLSHLALPLVARSLRAQSGVTWEPGFEPVPAAATVGVLVAFIALVAWASAARIRRVTTVAALRGGTATHSFSASPVPLATTRGPLSLVAGLQAGLQQWRQSLVIVVTVAIVTFAAVFSFGMTSTLLGSPDTTIELLVGELEDVNLHTLPGTDAHDLAREVEAVPGVVAAFPGSARGATIDGWGVMMLVTDDPSRWRFDPSYTGRLPRHDDEVALGAAFAHRIGLDVGDTWTVDLGQGEADFLVTGLATGARAMGQFAILPTDAYLRLDPAFTFEHVGVYVDGDPAAVVTAIKDRFPTQVDAVNDARQSVLVELDGYLSAVPALAGTVTVFTGVVVVLVVALIVTTMLVQSRRRLGIQKAMGWTNAQLADQTRWTYLPPVALGATLGGVAGSVGLAPLLGALLRGIGIMKVDAVAPPLFALGIPVAVVALALVVTALVSLRIRRVSAYALVTE